VSGIHGLHPYLPCERCFRIPPGPTDDGLVAGSPLCRCLDEEEHAAVRKVFDERASRAAAVDAWKNLPPLGAAA
jgi:hypothetical protein